MAAFGALLIVLVFGVSGLLMLFFVIRAAKSRKNRVWNLVPAIFFFLVIIGFWFDMRTMHNKSEMEEVGIYYLDNYPNCDSCILELKEDLTYEVRNRESVIEKSNWHYESGDDYWITYLDNDRYQLGTGKFMYSRKKP